METPEMLPSTPGPGNTGLCAGQRTHVDSNAGDGGSTKVPESPRPFQAKTLSFLLMKAPKSVTAPAKADHLAHYGKGK